jgi:hypothetical protein
VRPIAATGWPASWSAISVGGSSRAAAATCSASGARATRPRSRNGARRSLAIKSTSSSTPTSPRAVSSTGRWRMPWSGISISASVPERSAAIVHAGALMTAESGASAPAPSASTRVRMSRSVTIPSRPPSSTTTHVAPASTIRRAASATRASGAHTTAGARTSSPARRSIAAGGGSRSAPACSRIPADSVRATKRTASGRSSTGRIASAGMRSRTAPSSPARATNPSGPSSSTDAKPNISPSPSTSNSRPPISSSTDPSRTTNACSDRASALSRIAAAAGTGSAATCSATDRSAPSPSVSNGGWRRRNSVISSMAAR